MATINDVKYKFVNFNEKIAQLIIDFYTDKYPKGLQYTLDVPITNGVYLFGDELKTLVMSMAPVEQLTTSEQILDWEKRRAEEVKGIDFSDLLLLVEFPEQPIQVGAQTL